MAAYYNEIDPKAAAWLRELVKQGLIADGDVDETDIRDVEPARLAGYTQCHFFAGIGGWSYALRLAGWPDDRPVWTGSCPCQPFSAAGRREGVADERHLWPHWHHLISQRSPSIVFGEQVASSDGLGWLDLVSNDMEATGYAFGAADLCAAGIGAPHIRQRLYFVGVADTDHARSSRSRQPINEHVQAGWKAEEQCLASGDMAAPFWATSVQTDKGADGTVRRLPSYFGPGVDGLSARVGRLRGYGNAIVPQVAAAFVRSVMQ